MPTLSLSVVVPTLNEADRIKGHLDGLLALRQRGHEVIVTDGGSTDRTIALAGELADAVIRSARGRAAQMNAGAAQANGDVLVFLHADTRLPDRADELIFEGIAKSNLAWGWFDIMIEGTHPLFAVIAWSMNHRSRLTGICTGDQALFVHREVFLQIGGFADIPLMEDIDISKRLKTIGPPLCLPSRVTTSGRRWEKHGVILTILQMWGLRLAYCLGFDPSRLARIYGYEPAER